MCMIPTRSLPLAVNPRTIRLTGAPTGHTSIGTVILPPDCFVSHPSDVLQPLLNSARLLYANRIFFRRRSN